MVITGTTNYELRIERKGNLVISTVIAPSGNTDSRVEAYVDDVLRLQMLSDSVADTLYGHDYTDQQANAIFVALRK